MRFSYAIASRASAVHKLTHTGKRCTVVCSRGGSDKWSVITDAIRDINEAFIIYKYQIARLKWSARKGTCHLRVTEEQVVSARLPIVIWSCFDSMDRLDVVTYWVGTGRWIAWRCSACAPLGAGFVWTVESLKHAKWVYANVALIRCKRLLFLLSLIIFLIANGNEYFEYSSSAWGLEVQWQFDYYWPPSEGCVHEEEALIIYWIAYSNIIDIHTTHIVVSRTIQSLQTRRK